MGYIVVSLDFLAGDFFARTQKGLGTQTQYIAALTTHPMRGSDLIFFIRVHCIKKAL